MLGLSQQEMHVRAHVSKKTINDYENGFIEIRAVLAERLAAALRDGGARFIADEGYVGVIVYGRRAVAVPSGVEPAHGQLAAAGAAPARPPDVRRVRRMRHKD